MFLTETEAEARLAGLHRERSRLERAIADLTLFLAIGRQGGPDPSGARPPIPAEIPADAGWPVAERDRDSAASPPDESGTDRSLARREGRLLMEAAAEILAEAGRPLHAVDILDGLTRRGLSVPGVDPVAALNTRLWKRSGPDGAFRRLGDAVYALSGGDENA